jgi:hypothetical protein
MGMEYLHVAEVEFEARDGQKVFCEWTVSEYPVDCLNHVTEDTKNATLTKNFSFSWAHQPDD